jgi:GNAT superfamily N-acetyltransferase
MELRIATVEDFDIVYDMCLKFVNQTIYKKFMNEEVFKPLVESFIQDPKGERIGIIALDDGKPVGMIGGAITLFIFGGIRMCQEIAWWVEPEYRQSGVGKELVKALEYWANKMDCKFVTMSALDKEHLPKFYEKLGYSFAEISYMKAV